MEDNYSSHDFPEDDIFPQVQGELEALNSTGDAINKLENELQTARTRFRCLLADSTQRMNIVSKKIGKKWIIKSRPYYDLVRQSQKAEAEAQRAAKEFQRANSIYKAAKETVSLAEQDVITTEGESLAFTTAWQDMLNHANVKFIESEKEKRKCEEDHQNKAAAYATIQQRQAFLLKDMPRTIKRTKEYFDLKERLENRLYAEKQNIEDLNLAVVCAKQKYRMTLNNLEAISNQIHEERRMKLNWPARTPGVGAETDSEQSDMLSFDLDILSETTSQLSMDEFRDSRCSSPQFSLDISLNDEPNATLDVEGDGRRRNRSGKASSEPNTPHASANIWTRIGHSMSKRTAELNKLAADPGTSLSQSKKGVPWASLTTDALSANAAKESIPRVASLNLPSFTEHPDLVVSSSTEYRRQPSGSSLDDSTPVVEKYSWPQTIVASETSTTELTDTSSPAFVDPLSAHLVNEKRPAHNNKVKAHAIAKEIFPSDSSAFEKPKRASATGIENEKFHDKEPKEEIFV